MKDALTLQTKAFPAAGANNSTSTIDLGAARTTPNGFLPGSASVLEVSYPALPALADTKTVTFTINHSDDDSTYVTTGVTYTTPAGSGGGGVAANAVKLRIPPNVKRYVQVNAAVAAAGGDSTAKSYTAAILYGIAD